ncbi:MAG: hypothetical protein LBL41_02565 [Bifidobacteriaceae bacterium]|nr:hypothetical protein [Bifidobacteriaceae bacterium]
MINIKKKMTGAVMAFALVASVLVGGVGAPEVRAREITLSFCTASLSLIDDNWTSRIYNVVCTNGRKAAPTITCWSSGATNATKLTYTGAYVGSGSSNKTRPNGSLYISHSATAKKN